MSNPARRRVKSLGLAILVLACAIIWTSTAGQAKLMQIGGKWYDIAQPGEFIPGEIIVKAKPGVTAAAINNIAVSLKARVKKTIPEYDLYLLAFPAAATLPAQSAQVQTMAQALKAFPQVANAFPNGKVSIPKPIAPPSTSSQPTAEIPYKGPAAAPGPQNLLTTWQWHLDRIKYPFDLPLPTNAPTVAVLDTGVAADHPDLAGNVLTGYDFVLGAPGGTVDPAGHGTHVAGIIAARSGADAGVLGISPTSKILPVRVLGARGSGSDFDVIAGIVWARQQPGVKILNLSLGGYENESTDPNSIYLLWKKAIDDTVKAPYNKIICTSAGNDDNLPMYQNNSSKLRPLPAWFSNCFTVAASQEVDTRTYFSNYNASFPDYGIAYNFVDLAAPGWKIFSTVPDGYARMSGTSMSAPVVAGCAARVWAANPAWTNLQVQNRLVATGKIILPGSGFMSYPAVHRRVDLSSALGVTDTGIVGLVFNGVNGLPLSQVTVSASYTGGPAPVTATTNGSGFFTLKGLAAGKAYNLTFTKPGFVTLSYAQAYGGYVTTVAGKMTDVLMPVFLTQAAPGKWTVLITARTWHPGLKEAGTCYDNNGKPSWLPLNWDQTDGIMFDARLRQDSKSNAIVGPVNRGYLFMPPYAELTCWPYDWTYSQSCYNFIVAPQGSSVYYVDTHLRNGYEPAVNETWIEFGNYKGANVNATAFVYYGSTLKDIVRARLATGSGIYWQIGRFTGSTFTRTNILANDP